MTSTEPPFLTIITPLYNRKNLIGNCYQSLLAQTSKDFEWIIVDDGSDDQPEQVIKTFSQSFFLIRIIKKENGGKHTALNEAMQYIRGQYVLILDSDDSLTKNAVEKVLESWQQYSHRSEIGILTFLKSSDGVVPLCTVDSFGVPVDIMRYKRTVITSSDCCEVIRADLFLKYPFPVFEGERFLPECALWNRVALTHKCVYINEIIYLCEYLEGGLTKAGRKLRIQNPRGGMYVSNLRMSKNNFLKQRIKYAILYVCYGLFANLPIRDIIFSSKNYIGLKILCMLPGYGCYLLWKIKYI